MFMPKNFPMTLAAASLLALALITGRTQAFAATHESVLANFPSTQDGALPSAGLIFDSSGNLYGTTVAGGSDTTGTVFQLVPNADGTWTENVLHSFVHTTDDGWQPEAALVMDNSGNLYGTTLYGGAGCADQGGCGSVFELSPGSGGVWTETVLYSFCTRSQCKDGNFPYGGLILDASGNLYGTTSSGGGNHKGTVFELTPSDGKWTEKVLYNFAATTTDGFGPHCTLVFDKSGNLYGTTYQGGTYHVGTVFELTPGGKGGWTENVLHSFVGGEHGANPDAGVVFDASGNLYGTTLSGCSAYGCGTVYELVLQSNGKRAAKVLLDICTTPGCPGGNNLRSGVIVDAKGNVYGTATEGGTNIYGTAFRLTSDKQGNWSETVLHSFPSDDKDGYTPAAALVLDKDGNLYGSTYASKGGNGSVFKISF
jgi:uncharacterized repeat protein (TIGR03803 family)